MTGVHRGKLKSAQKKPSATSLRDILAVQTQQGRASLGADLTGERGPNPVSLASAGVYQVKSLTGQKAMALSKLRGGIQRRLLRRYTFLQRDDRQVT